MLSKIIRSTRKPLVLMQVALVAVALLIIASPVSASTQSTGGANTTAGSSQSQSQPNVTCPNGQCFTDVPSTNGYFAYINRIYQDGIVTGYACGGANEPCDSYH